MTVVMIFSITVPLFASQPHGDEAYLTTEVIVIEDLYPQLLFDDLDEFLVFLETNNSRSCENYVPYYVVERVLMRARENPEGGISISTIPLVAGNDESDGYIGITPLSPNMLTIIASGRNTRFADVDVFNGSFNEMVNVRFEITLTLNNAIHPIGPNDRHIFNFSGGASERNWVSRSTTVPQGRTWVSGTYSSMQMQYASTTWQTFVFVPARQL